MRTDDEQAEADLNKGYYTAGRRSPDDSRLLLAQLWEEGVEIRNHPMTVAHMFTPELEEWIQRITKWMEEVIDALKPLDAATAVWFRTLGNVSTTPNVPIPNIQLEGKEERAMYVKAFCEHDARLARFKDMLPKYGVGV